MSKKVRLMAPDFAKGVAILLMVYGHIDHVGGLSGGQKDLVKWIYTAHMPVFLLISGYLFRTDTGSPEPVVKILSRLVRPYVIFIGLYLVGLIVTSRMGIPTANRPPTSIPDFLDTVFLHPRGGYWFLHSLFLIQLALLLPGLVAPLRRGGRFVECSFSLLILALLAHFDIVTPRTTSFFLAGILLRALSPTLAGSILFPLVPIALLAGLAKDGIFGFSLVQVSWAVAILVLLAGIAGTFENSFFVRFFAWLGRNSLTILVFHALFIVALKLAGKPSLSIDPTGITYSVAVSTLCVAGCLFSAWVIDRLKLSKLLFGSSTIYSSWNASNKPSSGTPKASSDH